MTSMQAYLLRRIILLIPTLIGVTFIVFMSVRFLPGDIVDSLAGEFAATPEYRKIIEEQYKLNDNMFTQYFEWLGGIITLDFGDSLLRRAPVNDLLRQKLPATIQLSAMSLTLSVIIAIPVGIISAIRQDSAMDYVGRSFAVASLATPNFWIAIMVITFGFVWFGWTAPIRYVAIWDDPIANLKLFWVPAVILGTSLSGTLMRLTRSAMLEVLRQDYVRTAWAKGLRERAVISQHVVRNALIPVITIIGGRIPTLVGGTVIIETIFTIPGMGRLFFDSIGERDYTTVQAIVIISAVLVVVSNLVTDMTYSIIDPRIRVR